MNLVEDSHVYLWSAAAATQQCSSEVDLGPKRVEVTGGWRKLHNEELHNLYSSPSVMRMIK
jgi:hypothetical protein